MKAFEKCIAAIERLAQLGHELRRPEADYLRNGIYELRVRRGHVNYRILYSFINPKYPPGRHAAVLLHGFTKEAEVPAVELARATRRLFCFHSAPHAHTYTE